MSSTILPWIVDYIATHDINYLMKPLLEYIQSESIALPPATNARVLRSAIYEIATKAKKTIPGPDVGTFQLLDVLLSRLSKLMTELLGNDSFEYDDLELRFEIVLAYARHYGDSNFNKSEYEKLITTTFEGYPNDSELVQTLLLSVNDEVHRSRLLSSNGPSDVFPTMFGYLEAVRGQLGGTLLDAVGRDIAAHLYRPALTHSTDGYEYNSREDTSTVEQTEEAEVKRTEEKAKTSKRNRDQESNEEESKKEEATKKAKRANSKKQQPEKSSQSASTKSDVATKITHDALHKAFDFSDEFWSAVSYQEDKDVLNFIHKREIIMESRKKGKAQTAEAKSVSPKEQVWGKEEDEKLLQIFNEKKQPTVDAVQQQFPGFSTSDIRKHWKALKSHLQEELEKLTEDVNALAPGKKNNKKRKTLTEQINTHHKLIEINL